MITRKENLLVRPFQQRKYIQHRHKVVSALPRIDDVTPPQRSHVYFKCKKLQTEADRHAQIERDNFILLKHLSDIMTAKRIDNVWLYEQPKFQHRIKLFHNRTSKLPLDKNNTEETEQPRRSSAKERCIACNPDKFITPIIIPEERVPWESKPIREFSSTNKHNKIMKEMPPKKSSELEFGRDFSISKMSKQSYSSHPLDGKIASIRRKTAASMSQRKSDERIYLDKKMTTKEQPLTVIMKFPPTTKKLSKYLN